jgi:N-methylhydantoinase A/oxoprolinase/acetone carboxylase beta subunit
MYALGIDVGGSFTDGVLMELPGRAVLKVAKVPTDPDDLAASVLKCFYALAISAPSLLSRFCVSTTLATNAMVEGTKKDVCAICIGLRPKQSIEYANEVVTIDGGHDASGNEVHPLDLSKLTSAMARVNSNSFAISARFGVRNPEHEVMTSNEVLNVRPSATVVRGSELVGSLGMEERLFLAAKNAELAHVMSGLIRAIGSVTKVPASSTYILKGDGSLVSTEEAALKPIMTVLSGPAASAIGGSVLTGSRNALVIDVGGTTTDISLIHDGRVRLAQNGAAVGGSRLRVPAVDITTISLGGNTEIFFDDGRPKLGHRAVRPLCLAPDAPRLMKDRSFLFPVSGKVYGITPTDLFRAKGRSEYGDKGIATAALAALAQACDLSTDELFGTLEEMIRSRLLRSLSTALTEVMFSEGGDADALLRGGPHLRTVLRVGVPIVGIGAPVRPFLDLLEGRMECEMIVPEHHEVGNAVGVVCTGVFGRREVVVRCEPRMVQGEQVMTYNVTTSCGQRTFPDCEEAVKFAAAIGTSELRDYMERSRVRKYQTKVYVRDITYQEYGVRKVAETVVTVTVEER